MPAAPPPETPAAAGAAAHVFVDDVAAPSLSADDGHHLGRVLRLRAGDPVTVADGRGAWRRCTFDPGAGLVVAGDVLGVPDPDPALTVAFALTKGERPELAVQKLTELGIDRIVVFPARRSVARWDAERATRNLERLRRVAREAAMQSRRAWLPEVGPLTELATVLALPGAALADPGGVAPSLAHPVVAVGPEGGFTDEERAEARATVALGPLVLRAETAAMAAGALLAGLRAGLVGPVAGPRGAP